MKKREPSLHDLTRDTPVRTLSPLDDRLSRYNADLDSVPPPPGLDEERQSFVDKRLTDDRGKVSKSGSWDLEKILGGQQVYYERALERAIAEERRAHEQEKADEAKAELARRDKRIESVMMAAAKALAVAFALGAVGLIIKLIVFFK